MYVHRCDSETTTAVEVLAVIPATLRTAQFGNGRTFWLNELSDLAEDSDGVAVSSIYCPSCEKFVFSFDDDLNGRSLSLVESELEDGAYADSGIEWEE